MRYVFYAIAALLLLWSLYWLYRWLAGSAVGCKGGCGSCPGGKNCSKNSNAKNT